MTLYVLVLKVLVLKFVLIASYVFINDQALHKFLDGKHRLVL